MGEAHRILVIEDEPDISDFLSLELKHEGYEVAVAADGRTGLEMALEGQWDLILLDIMLPELSGMEVCRRIRAASQVPIIMLTARQSIPDRVAGLDAGADDYLPKPFAIEELLARIRVHLRRARPSNEDEDLSAADLTMHLSTREVERAGTPITLTAREFDLLELFVRNKNRVLPRETILEKVWGYDFSGQTNVVDVYVRYLRSKIDVPFGKPLIHTVRGVGYMLKE
ncbi:MAG: response regulator transcription factor [Alicyclobacillaceae bacterium]|nr:response regulator transcription factor [Alicyclobacillaceae bacterium]